VEVYGKEASTFLTNILKGEKVYLEYEKETQETDKYGRLLAYLYRVPDRLFINLEIIRQGYGHAYTKYPFKYMDIFRDTERQARESGKGLWSPDIETKTPANTEPIPTQINKDSKETKDDTIETTVYVTKSGTKYHRAGCKYLAKSMIPMSLKEAKTKYQPCSVCNPPK
jgi:micrococcal nuclease